MTDPPPLPAWGDRGAGVPLDRAERRRIDWTETTVVHARWCKAAACLHGVRDWSAYYDPRLTVSEHREVYERAGRPAEGARGRLTLRRAPPAARPPP